MKIVTKKIADGSGKVQPTLIMSREEWVRIGKIANFFDGEGTAMDELMGKMRELNEAYDKHEPVINENLLEDIATIARKSKDDIRGRLLSQKLVERVRKYLADRIREVHKTLTDPWEDPESGF